MGRASLLIDDDLRNELEREAELNGESPSDVAEAAIGLFLQAKAVKRAAIAEAAAEADKGIFISREAMDRWVSSWGTENELDPPEPDIFPDR
jgi:predicted transcriptional regulator